MTLPMPEISWEPTLEGTSIQLWIIPSERKSYMKAHSLPMTSVRELRDDMEEAVMLSRGTVKIKCLVADVLQYDKVIVGGNVLMVSDVLRGNANSTFLQFGDHYTEITFESDQQITVWRVIE